MFYSETRYFAYEYINSAAACNADGMQTNAIERAHAHVHDLHWLVSLWHPIFPLRSWSSFCCMRLGADYMNSFLFFFRYFQSGGFVYILYYCPMDNELT